MLFRSRKTKERPESTGESAYYSKKSTESVPSDVNRRSHAEKEPEDKKKKIYVLDVEMSDDEERSERDDQSRTASHPSNDATTDEGVDDIVSPSRTSEEEDNESIKGTEDDADSSSNESKDEIKSTPEPSEESFQKEVDISKKEEEVKEPKEELPPYYPAIQGCRSVDEFERLNKIEEGTYGVVYRAEEKRTGSIVALKRVKMEKEKEGFPITSLREISTLLKAQHPNIVAVKEIVVGSNIDSIFIVMEYVEHDLKSLMSTMKRHFTLGEVKTLMLQLLSAVAHLHDNWILHRDLKTSNLLFSHKGILKVGDFGLAREYGSPLKPYTPIVVTLWYRSPELLLKTKEYSCPIDLWSVGCIFGELLTMKPLFQGTGEIDQLNIIFECLGTPNEKIWPGYSELPLLQKVSFQEYPYNNLVKKKLSKVNLSSKGLDLINRFLAYCPERRITAEEALKHEFFTEAPKPIDPSMFPTWPAKSEQGLNKTQKSKSPKPPSGGKLFSKQLAADDDEKFVGASTSTSGFHMNVSSSSKPSSIGFSLKY